MRTAALAGSLVMVNAKSGVLLEDETELDDDFFIEELLDFMLLDSCELKELLLADVWLDEMEFSIDELEDDTRAVVSESGSTPWEESVFQ